MKKSFIFGAIFSIIGIGLIIASFILTEGFANINNYAAICEEKEYSCKGEVDKIIVSGTSGNVKVHTGSTDTVLIKYASSKDTNVVITEEDGELSIKGQGDSWVFNLFSLFTNTASFDVIIPNSYKGSLDIKTVSGDIDIDEFVGEDVLVKTVSGKIKVDDSIINGSLTAESTSGKTEIDETHVVNDLEVKMVSGSIELDRLAVGNDISLKTVSGSVNGKIKGDEDDYTITAKTVSGSSNLSTGGNGDKELKVETTSGSVKIKFY